MEALEIAGFPQPLEKEHLSRLVHQTWKEESVVCSVCDEICLLSRTKLLDSKSLPPSFFSELRTPTNVGDESPNVLPEEFIKQYDVSGYFHDDERFKNLLLSPRGIKMPTCLCQVKEISCCIPLLYICESSGCWQSLRRGTIPKFAIAQGNWIGQLPEELRSTTFGSRCLIRPVQSFGRLALVLLQ